MKWRQRPSKIEPADAESEKALALPEPVEQALAVIMQLDTEELAEEEQVAEPMTSGPAGEAVGFRNSLSARRRRSRI